MSLVKGSVPIDLSEALAVPGAPVCDLNGQGVSAALDRFPGVKSIHGPGRVENSLAEIELNSARLLGDAVKRAFS